MKLPLLRSAVVCWIGLISVASADDVASQSLAAEFDQQIRPVIAEHCLECHDAQSQEAGLDLSGMQRLADVTNSHPIWKMVMDRVAAEEMPPEDADRPLSDRSRQRLVGWIGQLREQQAAENAGDPGAVLVRRLNNAEYDYCISDLTGVRLRPTASFPIDPANEAGFDNTGESLRMSPALLNKYLDAARWVVKHLLLTPSGIRFAEHPVVTDTDRDKYCVRRIIAFYDRQPTDLAEYFYAAYLVHRRRDDDTLQACLDQIARQQSVSPKYLALIWQTLEEISIQPGPLRTLQQHWQELQGSTSSAQAQAASQQMDAYVKATRRLFEPDVGNLKIDGVHKGTQAFVLWKNDRYAEHRRRADFRFLDQSSDREDRSFETQFGFRLPTAAERERFESDCQLFCSVFPDTFFVSERGRDYLGTPKDEQEKGRLLSAGFHSMMGYYRDDAPLMELILDQTQQAELDQLWEELDFIATAPLRQYQGFLWFDRTDSRFMRDPEFDFARPENRDSLSQQNIDRLSDLYLAKARRSGGTEIPLQAIEDYFVRMNRKIRWVERKRIEGEPDHLDGCIDFAERAFRSPLSSTQQSEIRDYYRLLREEYELDHAEAIADTIVSILMSPQFCYRLDLLSHGAEITPLDDHQLASRLSFFLWSSIPDRELLQLAAQGQLRDPDVLAGQTRRLLRDNRIERLAVEFGGNWLDFRRFQQHNSVDRKRFPAFDEALREAMFQEPIHFLVDVAKQNRSVQDLLYAERTFVNEVLADHYGIKGLEFETEQWQQVDHAGRDGRGGLLPMAVFMTQNSPGLRTSPVKRGYWVVRRLLGERIPPPPPNVPDLPEDESQLGELTLAQTLAIHRDHASCAGCHRRFDSIGLAFEGFGPIGERRELDLGGRAVDTQVVYPDGSKGTGVAGLKAYLRGQRQAEFVDNLCRKLLAYALGRSLLLSDEALVTKMRLAAESESGGFGDLVELIVTSRQFLHQRGVLPSTATTANQGSGHE